MLNYNKNKLINECLDKYYETVSKTLDTSDDVPEEYNAKIIAYVFKNLRRAFRSIDREDRKYRRELRKKAKKRKAG